SSLLLYSDCRRWGPAALSHSGDAASTRCGPHAGARSEQMRMHGGQAREIVDVAREVGDVDDGDPTRQAAPDLLDAQRFAARARLVVDEVGRQLTRLRRADGLTEELRHLLELLGTDLVPATAAAGRPELRVHAVQDDALQRHAQR